MLILFIDLLTKIRSSEVTFYEDRTSVGTPTFKFLNEDENLTYVSHTQLAVTVMLKDDYDRHLK